MRTLPAVANDPHGSQDATLGISGPPPKEEPEPTSEVGGTDLDRYVMLEQIGAGGMGVVHRAYDPKLRREIAIKMLRFDRREGLSGQRAESRILREARAMAQLSHPNVLPVYDVERVGGLVYIAMEYVDGETLSRWMRRRPRPWSELLPKFRDAGQGLWAAHQAGIVHRDFKPSNVLLGNKGRVLVTDFGLARARGDTEAPDEPPDHWSSDGSGEVENITEHGEVVGTPAYMAPEQLRGEPVDARADQYAFSLALFEGLYRRRPFRQRETKALLAAKERGDYELDTSVTVPGWLLRVIERGLSPRPEARFSSMEELLEYLARDPNLARRRLTMTGAGLVVAVGAAAAARWLAPADDQPCDGASRRIESAWSEDRREPLRAALIATGQSYAADTAERVTQTLGEYASRWVAGYVDACEARLVRGEQSAEAFDLRMACLTRARVELEATVETLTGTINPTTLRRASSIVAGLPPPERCRDVLTLRARGHSADPEVASKIDALREDIARARALVRAGRKEDVRELVQSIEGRNAGLDSALVHSETLLLRASLASIDRDSAQAEQWYRKGLGAAIRARDAPLAVEAGTALVQLVNTQPGRTAEGELWIEQTRAWLHGLDQSAAQEARLWLAEGVMHQTAGHLERARTAFSQAVRILEPEQSLGDLAHAHHTLGVSLMALGEPKLAEDHLVRVLDLREELLGAHHPDVATAHQNVGAALYGGGHLTRALPHFERALALQEELLGLEHPRVVTALDNLGALRDDLGEPEEAREYFERALKIADRVEGIAMGERVGLRRNLALALEHAGHYAAAAEHLRQAASLLELSHGLAYPERIDVLTQLGTVLVEGGDLNQGRRLLEEANTLRAELPREARPIAAAAALALGRLLSQQGEHKRALKLLAEAVELHRGATPEREAYRGLALLELGLAQLAARDPAAARRAFDEAIPLLTTPQLGSENLARARFGLAQALVQMSPDRGDAERALQLAEGARQGLEEGAPLREEIDAWIRRER